MTPDEWNRAACEAAAPHAPADVAGLAWEQVEERLDAERDVVDAKEDARQREMANYEHCRRWGGYLEAWHVAADALDRADRHANGITAPSRDYPA